MAGRFVSQKDINLFNTINKELVGDLKNGKDGIINQTVVLYKLSVEDTQVNMYGESSNGKSYLSGVRLACLIEAEDFDFNTDEFGPDLRQDATFSFQRDVLLDLDLLSSVFFTSSLISYHPFFSKLCQNLLRLIQKYGFHLFDRQKGMSFQN